MTPIARITHAAHGRLRLQIRGRKGDHRYFAGLRDRLAGLPEVRSVQVNPGTGSVLLQHEGLALQALEAFADEEGLFGLVAEAAAGGQLAYEAERYLEELDKLIRRATAGGFDLRSAALGTLLLSALVQVRRGEVMAPAATLLWYAFTLVNRERLMS